MNFKETEVGKIPINWNVKKLSEIGEIVSGGTPKTKVEEYWNGNIPWITPKDLSGFTDRYINLGERSITEIGLEESSAKLLPKDTVLFSSRAPIGYVAIAGNEMATNQGFKSIICNENKAYPLFIYYLLKSKKESIESIAGGSTFKEISGKAMKEFKIQVPPITEQKAIANILSILDGKIEINNKINEKLEEMANALYKHWFVNFEFPNEKGMPYKSSGGIMVESELGSIPKGWKVKRIGEIVNITRGASPRPINDYITESGMPWVKISDATEGKSKYINKTKEFIKLEGISKSRKVTPGTLILSNSATPGIPKVMLIEACVHDGWLIFQDYQYITKEFLYYFLIHEREKILTLSNGSVFRNLKTEILKSYKILVPPKDVIKKINVIFHSFNVELERRTNEITILSNIRDILLPKLMSGEISIPLDNETFSKES